jgi:hypothetical protein
VGLTVADVTGDGIPDLVVANAGSDDLSVFIGVGRSADWTLEPRPRLPVGDDPVSTTVVPDGDGIPDLVAVDRGSGDVRVLTGVGKGFFDAGHPLILPAGLGPIRAFVGRFDAAPGLGLAVLDSGSSDLTDYSDFAGGTFAPRLISTGGPNPVAAVMGSYGDDGYSDLFIAHQGDSRIAFLDGGPRGLVLAATFDVGQSVQPTDLAVSGGESGSLQIYVATAGKSQVILLSVSLGVVSPAAGPAGGPPLQTAAAAPGSAGRGGLLSSAGSLLGIEGPSTEGGAQVQPSTQAETTAVVLANASAQGALAMGGITSMLPQIATPSLAPLTALVNNLVQIGQVQVSDLMPLDHSALDAVAVLVVVSGGAGEESIDGHAEWLEVDRAGASTAVSPLPPGASYLERYLSDIDGAPGRVPAEVLAPPEESPERWPDWVWDPGRARAVTVAGPRRPEPSVPAFDAPHGPDIVGHDDPGAGDADSVAGPDFAAILPLATGSLRLEPTDAAGTAPLGWGRPLAGMFVMSSLLFAGRAALKRRRVGQVPPADRRMRAEGSSRPTRRPDASKSPRARDDLGRDRPPSLAGSSARPGTSRG